MTHLAHDTLLQIMTAVQVTSKTRVTQKYQTVTEEQRDFYFTSSGGSRVCKRGVKVERRKRQYRGAEGAEGGEVWGGGFPLPTAGGVWGGCSAASSENFFGLWI